MFRYFRLASVCVGVTVLKPLSGTKKRRKKKDRVRKAVAPQWHKTDAREN